MVGKSLLMVGIALVAVWLLATKSSPGDPDVGARGGQKSDALGMRAVLRIDPKAGSFRDGAANQFVAEPVSANIRAYRDRKDYGALYEQLKAGEQTAESIWLQAKLIDLCAKRPKAPAVGKDYKYPDTTPKQMRERFLETLTPNDPNRARREAAYDLFSHNPCAGFREMTVTEPEIYQMFKKAAAGGDVRARADMFEQEFRKEAHDAKEQEREFPSFSLSDAQLRAMKELLASKDADVVRSLSDRLSGRAEGGALMLGDNLEPINDRAMRQAWKLVGCDLGANCGRNEWVMSYQCAHLGECEATNLIDHTFFYNASPFHAQLIDQYRQDIMAMMRSGDFSRLRIERSVPKEPPKK